MMVTKKEPQDLTDGKWLEENQFFAKENVVNTTDSGEHLELDNLSTDFSQYTAGEKPDDWTQSSPTGVNFLTYNDSSGEGGKVVRGPNVSGSTVSGGGATLSWDGINRKDIDIIASFRNATPNGNDRAWHGVIVRGKHTNNLDGYVAEISRQGGNETFIFSKLVDADTSDDIRPDKTDFDLYSEEISNYDSSKWYFVRIQAIGKEIKTKWWREDSNEPSNWNYSFTDSSELGSGFVGLILMGNYRTDLDARWDEFKIVTNNGYRVSNPLSLDSIKKVNSSNIKWTSTEPTDTDIKIYTAISESDTEEPGEYQEATNDSTIPGISVGDDLTGKYLWVRQELSTEDSEETPRLSSLEINVESPFTIKGKVNLNASTVEGAKVRLINDTTDSYVGDTVSDVNGDYEFNVSSDTDDFHVMVEYESGGNKYHALSKPFIKGGEE